MPTLYTMPGTCSLAPNIAIAWTDAPIEVHNMAYGDHKKDAYKQINPKAKVPALKMDDGGVLTEAAAILAYIGDAHGGAMRPGDAMGRARVAEALSFFTSEVHASYGPHFAKQRFAKSEAAQDEVQQAAYEALRDHYARMEENIGDAEHYLGARSLADPFLYVLTRWVEKTPLAMDDYPALKAFRERMEADEGVRRALERQDMKPIG